MALSQHADAGGNATSTSKGIAITTTITNCLIIVSAEINGGPIISVSDVAGLTWSLHVTTAPGQFTQEIWTAFSSGTLTGNTVTVTQTTSDFLDIHVIAVGGPDSTDIFDPNASVPDQGGGEGDISTDYPETYIFGNIRSSDTASPSAGTGFTAIRSGSNHLSEYKIVAAIQDNLAVGLGGVEGISQMTATAIFESGSVRERGGAGGPRGPLGHPLYGPFGGPI